MRGHPRAEDLLARLNADHSLQHEICATLERLADSLPRPIDRSLASRLISAIGPSWSAHIGFQDAVVFPMLRRCHASSQSVIAKLDRFETEHKLITGLAHEITEQLEIVAHGTPINAGMLGYMLRGAFQDGRRHIEAEQEFFSATIPKILTPVDRSLFETWLTTQAWPELLIPGTTKR
jgi:hemerythrin-like domain-containing protein